MNITNTKWLSALLLVFCTAVNAVPTPDVDGTGNWLINQNNFIYNIAASDEFNQVGNWQVPNPNKWNRSHPTGWTGNNSFTYNGNLAYTHQGNLVLEARPGAFVGDKHTTGIVSSVDRTFKYGYWEVRAKAATNNIASSFWFFNRNPANGDQYEIDVFEHFPYQPWGDQLKMKSNIHHFVWTQATGNVDQTPNYSDPTPMPNSNPVTNWNTFGVLRTDGGIYFYANGQQVRVIWKSQVDPADWPGDKEMPVILDILVYDWQTASTEPAQTRSYYYVDYFRVWN